MVECPICLEIIDDSEMILIECCQMKFCSICLSEWFRQSGNVTCPICHDILEQYYMSIDENPNHDTTIVSRLKVISVLIVIFILGKIYWSLSNTR